MLPCSITKGHSLSSVFMHRLGYITISVSVHAPSYNASEFKIMRRHKRTSRWFFLKDHWRTFCLTAHVPKISSGQIVFLLLYLDMRRMQLDRRWVTLGKRKWFHCLDRGVPAALCNLGPLLLAVALFRVDCVHAVVWAVYAVKAAVIIR